MMMVINASDYVQTMIDTCGKLGKYLNYEFYNYSSNMDYDAYVNQISVFANNGYNGLMLSADDSLKARAIEMCKENKIAFIGCMTALTDDKGVTIWPSVAMDDINMGAACIKWLIANYKNYWKDPIDPTKLGCIDLTLSATSGIHNRLIGVKNEFLKAYPQAEKNMFVGDLISAGVNAMSPDAASDMTAQIISAHPEIKKWFIVSNVSDWGWGATRAAEALKKEDSVLVASVMADSLITQVESGYTGNVLAAACAFSPNEMAAAMASGLVAMLDGRAKPETLWPEFIKSGEKYADYTVKYTMVTKDNYKAWQKSYTLESLTAGMKAGS